MDDSPLATLPPEIRTRIYTFTLCQDVEWALEVKSIPVFSAMVCMENSANALAITRVCKTIRAESRFIFFAVNTFKMLEHGVRDVYRTLKAFECAIGPESTAALRDIDAAVQQCICFCEEEGICGSERPTDFCQEIAKFHSWKVLHKQCALTFGFVPCCEDPSIILDTGDLAASCLEACPKLQSLEMRLREDADLDKSWENASLENAEIAERCRRAMVKWADDFKSHERTATHKRWHE